MRIPISKVPLLGISLVLAAGTSLEARGLPPATPSTLAFIHQSEGARLKASQEHLQTIAPSLGFVGPHSFSARKPSTDEFGQTHIRFSHYFQGVRVWGSEAVTHVDAEGKQLSITNGLQPVPAISASANPQPALTPSEALYRANKALAPKGNYAYPPSAELVWYPVHGGITGFGGRSFLDPDSPAIELRLSYFVHTALSNAQDGIRQTDFIVDAQDGKILQKWNSLESDSNQGNSQYSGTVGLNVTPTGSGYTMRSTTYGLLPHPFVPAIGTGNPVLDSGNQWDGVDTYVVLGPLYTDPDGAWGDGSQYDPSGATSSTNGQTAAVDASYGVEATFSYYKNIHGRDGVDGLGSSTLSRVHVGQGYDNAYWDNYLFGMSFGDGSNLPGGCTSLTALDVTGHELSHGVTHATAGLFYFGESGGLNEANSDIHGSMVEFYARGNGTTTIPETGGNFLLGEQVLIDPSDPSKRIPLRTMYHPSKDGWSADYVTPLFAFADVHYSSGPMNRAFYFLAQGAASTPGADTYTPFLPQGMSGVGNDKAARIWYRALTTYMTPFTKYVGAQAAAVKAAGDLYGAPEVSAVKNAFAGIGVGSSGTVPITPNQNLVVSPGATLQLHSPIAGVSWSATDGAPSAQVNTSGAYTAPTAPGFYHILATNPADGSTGMVTVLVAQADLDGDGQIDGWDMGALFGQFLTSGADLTGDGNTNEMDFYLQLNAFYNQTN